MRYILHEYLIKNNIDKDKRKEYKSFVASDTSYKFLIKQIKSKSIKKDNSEPSMRLIKSYLNKYKK
jgi:hypothetical protein